MGSISVGWEALKRMGSISGGWEAMEAFQEDGEHFRRMGSISGGWEAFKEDRKQFRRKDTKEKMRGSTKGRGRLQGWGSKANLEHQIVQEHASVSYVKEGRFNYFHERY
jgi:hypothetical protein